MMLCADVATDGRLCDEGMIFVVEERGRQTDVYIHTREVEVLLFITAPVPPYSYSVPLHKRFHIGPSLFLASSCLTDIVPFRVTRQAGNYPGMMEIDCLPVRMSERTAMLRNRGRKDKNTTGWGLFLR